MCRPVQHGPLTDQLSRHVAPCDVSSHEWLDRPYLHRTLGRPALTCGREHARSCPYPRSTGCPDASLRQVVRGPDVHPRHQAQLPDLGGQVNDTSQGWYARLHAEADPRWQAIGGRAHCRRLQHPKARHAACPWQPPRRWPPPQPHSDTGLA